MLKFVYSHEARPSGRASIFLSVIFLFINHFKPDSRNKALKMDNE